jgi:hypothetical protein
MKSLLMGLVLVACATSAEAAEAWTCSWVNKLPNRHIKEWGHFTTVTELIRFDVSPPEVTTDVGELKDVHFRIVQNDDTGLVAAGSRSETKEGQNGSLVVALTVAINKVTGEFAFAFLPAIDEDSRNDSVHGRCLKN